MVRKKGVSVLACVGLGLVAAGAGVRASPDRAPSALASPDLAARAARLAPGEPIRVEAPFLAPGREPVGLELRRVEVFAPGSRILVHGPGSVRRMLRDGSVRLVGRVEGEEDSLALLRFRPDGALLGFVSLAGRVFAIDAPGGGAATARAREVRAGAGPGGLEGPRCAAELLGPVAAAEVRPATRVSPGSIVYRAELALETDHEYFLLFPSAEEAAAYAGDLVAGVSEVYRRDVKSELQVRLLSLWSTPDDPWTQASQLCTLFEFGNYWNNHHRSERRDAAHFLSGRPLGGGVAWTGTLCGSDSIQAQGACPGLPSNIIAGAYGVSSRITGSYGPGNPETPPVWDIYVVSHELGHTFGSVHTHCYGNIPAPGDPPVDTCSGSEPGCWSGPTAVPPGGGSIMSYCNLQPGGMANLNLWLGRAGHYGTRSERVPETLRAKVESVAGKCLDLAGDQPQLWHSWFAVDARETPMTGDLDGDGRADVITFTRDNPLAYGDVYVAMSLGDRFGDNRKWHDFFAIDRSEVVVIGDYDGDGRDDIATWLRARTRQVYVSTSLASGGLGDARVWLDSLGGDPLDVLAAGDANGDGRADLILFERSRGRVQVAPSLGDRFAPPATWHTFFAVSGYERPRVADLNGDGLGDILTLGTDSPTAFGDVYVALSDGSRFGDAARSLKWHDFFAVQPGEEVRTGDRNGDGQDDLFTFLPAPHHQVYTVDSLGGELGPNRLHAAWNPPPEDSDLFFVGDANGDGRADIIQFARSRGHVLVFLSR